MLEWFSRDQTAQIEDFQHQLMYYVGKVVYYIINRKYRLENIYQHKEEALC